MLMPEPTQKVVHQQSIHPFHYYYLKALVYRIWRMFILKSVAEVTDLNSYISFGDLPHVEANGRYHVFTELT